MNNQESEVAVIKSQVERIVADIESEKSTRSRVNAQLFRRIDESDERTAEKIKELDSNQRRSDKIIYMMFGGVAAIQFVTTFLHR